MGEDNTSSDFLFTLRRQTKGLSLEEINEKFGESVEVHLTQLTDQEKAKLDMALEKHVQGTAGDVVELHQGKAE